MEQDWDKKLAELERALDGAGGPLEASPPAEPPAKKRDTRVLRWAVIGVGTGVGLVLAYFLLKPLLAVALLAGMGYGGYRIWKYSKDQKAGDD